MKKVIRLLSALFYCLLSGIPIHHFRCIKGRVIIDDHSTVKIGSNVRIYGLVVSGAGNLTIEDDVEIRNLYVHVNKDASVCISKGCFIGADVKILSYKHVLICENCLISPNVVIVDNDHVINEQPIKLSGIESTCITIHKNSWIGAATILGKGSSVGENSIIGAASFLNTQADANSIYFGVPARFVKRRFN